MVLNTFWDGLVPIPLLLHPHVCPPDTVFVIEVAEATLALANTSITSLFCMPAGGTIVAVVAVVTESSLAGIRDSPTMVIGGPPAAAARSAGIAAPPLMNAELELRKAICACAALPSVMPASAPINSTARTSPRCRRDSACLRVVRVTFIVISSCSHSLLTLACKKILSWPVIDVQSRAGGPFRPTSGLRRRNSFSTARETRGRRGRILALGERRLQLPLNVARCGCRVRASARAHDRLIARGGDDLIGADVAVAFAGRCIDRRVASDRHRERRQRPAQAVEVGRRRRARRKICRPSHPGQVIVRIEDLPRAPFHPGARALVRPHAEHVELAARLLHSRHRSDERGEQRQHHQQENRGDDAESCLTFKAHWPRAPAEKVVSSQCCRSPGSASSTPQRPSAGRRRSAHR